MTPIQRIKSHLKLFLHNRRLAVAAQNKHNPLIVRVGGKGQGCPGKNTNLEDALEIARTKVRKLLYKFARGEVEEKTLKQAEVYYISLVRKEREAMQRMKTCHVSVEYCEGGVQMGQIAVDVLESAAARMRRGS